MVRFHLFAASLAALAIAFTGCNSDTSHGHSHGSGSGSAAGSAAAPGSTAATGSGHEGHDHAAGSGHGHEGAKQDLGDIELGGVPFEVIQVGKVEAGKEGVFEVGVKSGADKVTSVRGWVGTEDAKGSVKAKGEIVNGDCDLHIELPAALAADSAFWLEVEIGGTTHKHAFPLK